MNPVPFWFGLVTSTVAVSMVTYILWRLWREWSARLPAHVEQAVYEAYTIQHHVIERGENDSVLEEVATLVRAIRSSAHIGDEASLFALLETLRAKYAPAGEGEE